MKDVTLHRHRDIHEGNLTMGIIEMFLLFQENIVKIIQGRQYRRRQWDHEVDLLRIHEGYITLHRHHPQEITHSEKEEDIMITHLYEIRTLYEKYRHTHRITFLRPPLQFEIVEPTMITILHHTQWITRNASMKEDILEDHRYHRRIYMVLDIGIIWKAGRGKVFELHH